MTEPAPSRLWLSGRVMRWHANARLAGTGDRLDGHHARVAQLIIEAMAPQQPSANLLIAALTHDAGEYAVGDLPGDMKRQMPDVAERHALVEECARDAIAGAFPELTESEATYLRWADRTDAFLWAQHHGENMRLLEWRLALEEIARLAAMLGIVEDDNGGDIWGGFDANEVAS